VTWFVRLSVRLTVVRRAPCYRRCTELNAISRDTHVATSK